MLHVFQDEENRVCGIVQGPALHTDKMFEEWIHKQIGPEPEPGKEEMRDEYPEEFRAWNEKRRQLNLNAFIEHLVKDYGFIRCEFQIVSTWETVVHPER